MTAIAKRRLRETWREAVGARAGPHAERVQADFDRLRQEGMAEAEAAFRALESAGRLWAVDEPIGPTPPGEVPLA